MEIEKLARIASEARKAMNHGTNENGPTRLQIAHGRCGIGTKRRKRENTFSPWPVPFVTLSHRWNCNPRQHVGRWLRLAYRTRSRCNCWHFRVPSLGSRDEESRRRMAGTTLCKTWTAFEPAPIHFATEKILASASMRSHLSIIRSRSLSSSFLPIFFLIFEWIFIIIRGTK